MDPHSLWFTPITCNHCPWVLLFSLRRSLGSAPQAPDPEQKQAPNFRTASLQTHRLWIGTFRSSVICRLNYIFESRNAMWGWQLRTAVNEMRTWNGFTRLRKGCISEDRPIASKPMGRSPPVYRRDRRRRLCVCCCDHTA